MRTAALLETFLPAIAGVPPAFGAAGTGLASGTFGTKAVPLPAGIVAGQLLLLHVQMRSAANDTTVTTPAGWTRFSDNPSGTNDVRSWAFWRIATGGEGATVSVTTTASGSPFHFSGRSYRLTGAHATTPIEAFGALSGAANSILGPSLTPGGANRIGIALVAVASAGSIGPFTGASGGTWSEPISEFSSFSGADGTLQIQVASLTGPISGGTVNSSVSAAWTVLRFAVAPA